MQDLLIIGGGPAGVAAGVYAARKLLRTTLVAEEIGGQSTVSEGIENWIGTVRIPGSDLIRDFKTHLDAYKGEVLSVREGVRVTKLERGDAGGFVATLTDNSAITAKAVLIASGASRRRLDIAGADTFEHKGLTYCASCDGPIFSGMDVAVVGGGNAGFESALQLLAYCKSVTLVHRNADFKADAITVRKALEHPNFTALTNTQPVEVVGEKFVQGLVIRTNDDKEQTLAVNGVFVEIGVMPSTGFATSVVDLDEMGRIIANPRNQRTSTEGVWAAGDCTDELYHQNNIAAGDGVKALEDIYLWLKRQD